MNNPIDVLRSIDPTALQQARARAVVSQQSIVAELQTSIDEDPRQLIHLLAEPFGLPVLEMSEMMGMTPAFNLMPLSKCMQKNCVLLRGKTEAQNHQKSGQRLIGVFTDPFDVDIQTWGESQAKNSVHWCLALQSDLHAYLSRQEASARAVDNLEPGAKDSKRDGKINEVLSFASVSEAASPAIRLVNSTLYDALKAGASDIHLESTSQGLAIKYRIDGVLDHAASVDGVEAAEQVISRLKVLAELDIAERRIPQDGSFRVEAEKNDIDLRVSIMPSIHGEDAVIRILDKRAMIAAYGALTLDALGFDTDSVNQLRSLAEEPYGMLLVTGPTGSGKTTTLYAALTEIHDGRNKIITIEDPVEYQLPGILQIPVNEKKGLTFAKGLRSILRHDPDKIMIGEIRDRETAEIATQSALTGHLVLTTVHANNVFDVFGRFSHMGLDPYAFVSALNGIWAQRLVRLNCPHCTTSYEPSALEITRAGLQDSDFTDYSFQQGNGCGDCRGTGYKGRRAIAEILKLDDEIRELIIEKRPMRQIKDAAYLGGTRSLREVALNMVRAGNTTLEEVKRVTLHA
ncbi:GspE/PulE family protein [Undibacterium sp. TJN25]|uniref:GspE/PulE family protein n=1 Tax=Undibacterium sp. TJN25 TaxID=3413056 RepID=UPI003BF3CD15